MQERRREAADDRVRVRVRVRVFLLARASVLRQALLCCGSLCSPDFLFAALHRDSESVKRGPVEPLTTIISEPRLTHKSNF